MSIDFIEKTIERLRYQRSIWWKRTSDDDPTKEPLPIIRRRRLGKSDDNFDPLRMDRRNIALLGGVGGMAALLSAIDPKPAYADQAFTAFAYPGTGEPTSRTTPDRLIDYINVKDWGAVGNSSTDDQPAIQNAVAWQTTSAARGLFYFPPAQANKIYLVNSAINLLWVKTSGATPSWIFSGCGSASKVSGTVDHGYIFWRDATTYTNYSDKGLMLIEKLYINNTSTTSDSGAIQIATAVGSAVRDCQVEGQNGIIFQNGNDVSSGNGLFVFTSTIENCVLAGKGKGGTATGTGIAMSQGGTVIGCDITAFFVGIRCFASANNIIGGRFEANDTAITTGINIVGGNTGGNGEITIQSASFESNNTGLDASHGFSFMSVKDCSFGALDGLGTDGIVFSDATGKWATLENVQATGGYSGYAIRAQWDPTRGASCIRTFINTNAYNTHDPTRSWLLTSGNGMGAPKLINCNNPDLTSTFVNLPSGGVYQRAAGDTYMVSDSPTAASGNFGATVSAGSSSNLTKLLCQSTAQCQQGIISNGGTAAEFIGTVGAIFTGQMTTATAMTVTSTNGWLVAGDTVTGGSGINAISVTIVSGPGGDGSYVTSANANTTTTAVGCTSTSTTLHVTAVMQGTITNGDTISGSSYADAVTSLQDRTITGAGAGGGVGDYPISSSATREVNNGVFTASISGTTLTVTAIITGTVICGSVLTGAGITAGTVIVNQLTTTNPLSGGGIGTYTISNSLTVSSETMTSTKITLGSGTPGTVLTPGGIQSGTFVGSGMQIMVQDSSNTSQRWVTSTSPGGSQWNLTAIGGGGGSSKFRGPGYVYGTLWVID